MSGRAWRLLSPFLRDEISARRSVVVAVIARRLGMWPKMFIAMLLSE
jgi:hypothetical protein